MVIKAPFPVTKPNATYLFKVVDVKLYNIRYLSVSFVILWFLFLVPKASLIEIFIIPL
jgi:hypothetical protein